MANVQLTVDEALARYPPGHPERLDLVHNLGLAFYTRFSKSGRTEDLERTISFFREALALRPLGHPDRSMSLNNLGDALHTCFNQLGRLDDLEEAISFHREALTLNPPDRAISLNNLGITLNTRFNQSGRLEDLEESISSYREALTHCPNDHPNRSTILSNLGVGFSTRFDQSGRLEDLEAGISSHREALALCPPDQPRRSNHLINFGIVMYARFKQLGRSEDLEEGISAFRQALALWPPGHPERSISLNNLGDALHTRFDQFGKLADLEEGISSHREALSLRSPGHPQRSSSLSNLGISLDTRFNQLGKLEDLEEAISFHREALTLRPSGHPERSISLSSLGSALCTRFDQLGRLEDLEEGLSFHREALSLRSPGHPLRSTSLSNLGDALHTRFNQLGRLEDLEDTISSLREAISLLSPGHPQRASIFSNLGIALGTRFNQLSRIEDLEEEVSSHREALTLRPPGHPDRSLSLNNLGVVLGTRFNWLRRPEDLEEQISSHREALTLRPPGHPKRPSTLNNLGIALHNRFEQPLGTTEDLDAAISCFREALTLCPPGHPSRSNSLIHLGGAIRTHFNQLASLAELEDTISSFREALTLCPPGHPKRSIYLGILGDALHTRFTKLHMTEDLDEAFSLYEQSANDFHSISRDRLEAALRWASRARLYRPPSAIRAYSLSLQLLNRCLISHPDINSQQKYLATSHIPRSLASDAASAAIAAGDLESAVELLEQGRAILWSKLKGYRSPLDQLRQIDAQLANRLETVSVELERLALPSRSEQLDGDGPISLGSFESQMRRHRILSNEWEVLVGEAQKIEGFSNFLRAIPFNVLRTTAAEGPVILVNISEYRCDAIILHINHPPILVALPNARPEGLIRLANSKQFKLARNARANIDHSEDIDFGEILRNLWNDIVSPVVDRLIELEVPEKSRVWWCPTSELWALPLHAAGPYRRNQKGLPDIYISSYIPTLSALITARSNCTAGQSVVPKLLVVGQPDETLVNVQDEIKIVRQLTDSVDVMIGAEASHVTVLDGLQRHSWAHFACHGHLGDGNPFHASFQLHGGDRLTLLDLIHARLPNAELAFLSACHSASPHSSTGELITPDETIHLAAALQFCGFRSVVGTLWAMADMDGPTISKEFYEYMFRNPGNVADFRESAQALNLAIRALRKKKVPLERWIMFVHIGA